MPTRRMTTEKVILKDNKKSRSMGGTGMIITTRIHITARPIKISAFLKSEESPGIWFSVAVSINVSFHLKRYKLYILNFQ
jgi:hypothetical protein